MINCITGLRIFSLRTEFGFLFTKLAYAYLLSVHFVLISIVFMLFSPTNFITFFEKSWSSCLVMFQMTYLRHLGYFIVRFGVSLTPHPQTTSYYCLLLSSQLHFVNLLPNHFCPLKELYNFKFIKGTGDIFVDRY